MGMDAIPPHEAPRVQSNSVGRIASSSASCTPLRSSRGLCGLPTGPSLSPPPFRQPSSNKQALKDVALDMQHHTQPAFVDQPPRGLSFETAYKQAYTRELFEVRNGKCSGVGYWGGEKLAITTRLSKHSNPVQLLVI